MNAKQPRHRVIAIDGPSGAGKSTVAQRVAQRLGYHYVDSGALYRAVGWVVQARALPLEDNVAIADLLAQNPIVLTFQEGRSMVWVDKQNITPQLRGETVGKTASAVAVIPIVREYVTARLRRLRCHADLVIEGRDIGTVVFPDATAKFYLDAAPEVRGQRRFQEMQQEGQGMSRTQVGQAVAARDTQDRTRPLAPLRPAADACSIDTTDLVVDDVVRTVLSEVRAKIIDSVTPESAAGL